MGFEPQIRRIVQDEGMSMERQTFMFSATFPVEIQRLAGDFMKEYIFLAVGRVGAASKDVTQRVEWVEQNDKIDYVIEFLGRVPEGLVLIFVETKRGADHLEEVCHTDAQQYVQHIHILTYLLNPTLLYKYTY
jgi:ATP-dependent RNA helicase DDX3X